VIEEARARQRREQRIGFVALVAAAAVVAAALAFVGGGGSSVSHRHPGTATPALVAAQFRNVSGAPCVWHPTISGTPSRSLLSILGVFERSAGLVNHVPSQLLPAPGMFGEELYARYVRRAGTFAGGPTYLYLFDDTGCDPSPAIGGSLRIERRWLGDDVGIYRPGIHEQGEINGGAAAIDSGQWVWLGGPGIKGLASTSETITLLVPDQVASVTIRYPTEAVEPAYHKHPGPTVPALTINVKPINNVVTFNLHHHSSAAMAPLTVTWRATSGVITKTFHRL
jgi:hypothetical protein